MLYGKRVFLRSLEENDLNIILGWRNKDNNRKYFREYRLLNKFTQKKWFQSLHSKKYSDHIMFIIVDKSKNNILGVCGICNIDYINDSGEISFYIGESYVEDVYSPDAMKILINYAFNELNLHRLWAEIYEFDCLKSKLLKKSGFHMEGTLKEAHKYAKKWWDINVFGLINH